MSVYDWLIFNWSEEAFYPLLLSEEKEIQIVTLLGR